MQPGWTRTYVKVARRPLIEEPYDPDAKDGDGDGIVQEWTPWERPVGTFFVKPNGQPYRAGMQMAVRPASARLVDKDGNEVDYVPTYRRQDSGEIGPTIGEIAKTVVDKRSERIANEKNRKKAPRPSVRKKVIQEDIQPSSGLHTFEPDDWDDLQSRVIDRWQKSAAAEVEDLQVRRLVTGEPIRRSYTWPPYGKEKRGPSGQIELLKMALASEIGAELRARGIDIVPSLEKHFVLLVDEETGEMSLFHKSVIENFDDTNREYWKSESTRVEVVPDRDANPRYEEFLFEALASMLIQQWAGNDTTDFNKSAQRLYGNAESTYSSRVSGSLLPSLNEIDEEIWDYFLDIVYERTQKLLQERGIKSVDLHRGIVLGPTNKESEAIVADILKGVEEMSPEELRRLHASQVFEMELDMMIELSPSNAFAFDEDIADMFSAEAGIEYDELIRLLMSGQIPAERILSTAVTGFGCFDENEFVVIGGGTTQFRVKINVESFRLLLTRLTQRRYLDESDNPNKQAALRILENWPE